MSETVASAGTTAGPKVATPAPAGFWRQLVTGPGGLADEAALVFLAGSTVVLGGAISNAIVSGHFQILDTVGGLTGLLAIYNASVRIRGQGQ